MNSWKQVSSFLVTTTKNSNKLIQHRFTIDLQYHSSSKLGGSKRDAEENLQDDELLISGYKRPTVNWYPGHIAKAERQLSETLKAVDVVIEVRDARACKATSHYKVAEWCAGTPRIVVMTHADLIPKSSMISWKRSYDHFGAGRWDGLVNAQIVHQAVQSQLKRNKNVASLLQTSKSKNQMSQSRDKFQSAASKVEDVLFVNAKNGQGMHALLRSIVKAGAHVQERRTNRGLKDRPLRVGVLGYPNVGKSALINRILGRRLAKAENKPGVTRSLRWIRVNADDSDSKRRHFELLDSPGVIPAKMLDQSDAVLLAACNCIGEAAYDNEIVASYLLEWIKALLVMNKGEVAAPDFVENCLKRYGIDPRAEHLTGEDIVYQVAEDLCFGSREDASRKILQDFRTGRLGPICLQLAPESEEDEGQLKVSLATETTGNKSEEEQIEWEENRRFRAEAAVEKALQRGLELPPMVQQSKEAEVGKGFFDGW
jgi:ribosome biogenesis GTPase A